LALQRKQQQEAKVVPPSSSWAKKISITSSPVTIHPNWVDGWGGKTKDQVNYLDSVLPPCGGKYDIPSALRIPSLIHKIETLILKSKSPSTSSCLAPQGKIEKSFPTFAGQSS
jgi:hypothetical protein